VSIVHAIVLGVVQGLAERAALSSSASPEGVTAIFELAPWLCPNRAQLASRTRQRISPSRSP
jgi:hypothetical protein